MKTIVMKFGGVLVQDAPAILHAAQLVAQTTHRGMRTVVVVSAMAGVTDQLLTLADQASQGREGEVAQGVDALEHRHEEAVRTVFAAAPAMAIQPVLDEEHALAVALRQTLAGVAMLRELTARSRDLIVSFGERCSAPIMAAALRAAGLKSRSLTGGEAGIVTDDAFGSAAPRMDMAKKTIPREVGPLLERGLTPVVTGFIAANEEGVITTLGRGGSDYTATILGACLPADEVWIWKEVDGVMTADPKLVPDAVRVPALSYREVMELAWFGAKVLHPMTVSPVQQAAIPLRIRSAFLPSSPGTIVCESAPGSGPVKAVTSIRRLTALTVSGGPATGTSELVGRVFKVLAAADLQVLMISQSSSLANVSLVMPQADADKARRLLAREFAGGSILGDIAAVPHVSIVTIVGDGMRGTPGIASTLCSALAAQGVNLLMIAQGSSEVNISVAIPEKHTQTAVRAIHAAFGLAGCGGNPQA
ncbi:MAG TPA: aspartate kinase [Candidatus Cryosericum sp.]|nr:aspartate kinase [Candidatus Cryosericum sp.]